MSSDQLNVLLKPEFIKQFVCVFTFEAGGTLCIAETLSVWPV